jgi:two-component system, NarL family, response regulator DesR
VPGEKDLMETTIRVMCADDNGLVTSALAHFLSSAPGIEWAGSIDCADDLIAAVAEKRPDVLVMDIDMPGRDSFEAVRELCDTDPAVRVVFFSGHIRAELIDRAIDCGAWGYVSKSDGESALLDAIRAVGDGRFTLGQSVNAMLAMGR